MIDLGSGSPAAARQESESVRGARILVVDDQPANVHLLTRMLRQAGVRNVVGVTEARDAYTTFLRYRPALVLLDLHMPHVDGFALLEAFREASEDVPVPVVVLTADASSRARERALLSGAKDFLVKPFDRTELLLRVRNLLETRELYSRLHEHTAELEARVNSTIELERQAAAQLAVIRERIEDVLVGRRLSMVFQPIIDLDAGTVVGVEALARFAATPVRPPDQWFAEASNVGLGVELELQAVVYALEVLQQLPEPVYLSFNLSPDAMCSAGLINQLRRHSPERLVVEMTEHAQVADYQELAGVIDELRGLGARLAVDDAGAGFSSLQHILRLHPDIIKLDLTLTRDIHRDPVRRALAASLVSFAREINAALVAEGVESAAEVTALRQLGVTCGQGFGLARPGPWSSRTTMPIGPWYRHLTGG